MSGDAEVFLSEYSGHGVRFLFPGYWEVREERDGDDVILTAAADDSCFWLLRVIADRPSPEQVLQDCLQALQEEYEDLEQQQEPLLVAGRRALGCEVTFSCLELLNAAGFCSVRSGAATLLIWWQCTDHELADVRPVFQKMTQSVAWTADSGAGTPD
ncbi:MAG: hypothetical protein RIT02_1220 [Planctomycetota bacterium]|jgi:hypothetical protein